MAELPAMDDKPVWRGAERRTNVRLRTLIDRMKDEIAAQAVQIAALRADVDALKRAAVPARDR